MTALRSDKITFGRWNSLAGFDNTERDVRLASDRSRKTTKDLGLGKPNFDRPAQAPPPDDLLANPSYPFKFLPLLLRCVLRAVG
jgi:hypothetical protein